MQIGIVGLLVNDGRRFTTGCRNLDAQRALQRIDDRHRYLVLDCKHISQLPVVGVRPQVAVRPGLDQLCRDAYPISGLAYGPLQHVPHTEPFSHGRYVDVLALELEGGRARCDLQVWILGKNIQDLLRDPIAEILLIGIGRHIHERQYGNRNARGLLYFARAVTRESTFPKEITDRHNQADHDRPVQLLSSLRGNGLASINLLFELDTVGRQLENPCENHDDRKADAEYQHDGLEHPVRCLDIVQDDVRDLQHQPGHHHIGDSHAKHIAALQLGEKGQSNPPVLANDCGG